MRLIRWALIIVLSIFILIWGGWLFVIPQDAIRNLIEQERDDISIKTEGFRKGIFFNLSAESALLQRHGSELIKIDEIRARIEPRYLLLFRIKIYFEGKIGEGRIAGSLLLKRKTLSADMKVTDVEASNIAYISALGIVERGNIDGDLALTDGSGEVRLSFNDVILKDKTISGVPLPLHIFNKAKASFIVRDGALNINSFALEGADIYARVRGRAEGKSLDMEIEIMPSKGFKDRFLLLPIERYKVSEGYYLIPVKGQI